MAINNMPTVAEVIEVLQTMTPTEPAAWVFGVTVTTTDEETGSRRRQTLGADSILIDGRHIRLEVEV